MRWYACHEHQSAAHTSPPTLPPIKAEKHLSASTCSTTHNRTCATVWCVGKAPGESLYQTTDRIQCVYGDLEEKRRENIEPGTWARGIVECIGRGWGEHVSVRTCGSRAVRVCVCVRVLECVCVNITGHPDVCI